MFKAFAYFLWNYRQADYQAFRNALSEATFDELFSNGDVDDACTKWTELFLATVKAYAPNTLVTVRPNGSLWYTNELKATSK